MQRPMGPGTQRAAVFQRSRSASEGRGSGESLSTACSRLQSGQPLSAPMQIGPCGVPGGAASASAGTKAECAEAASFWRPAPMPTEWRRWQSGQPASSPMHTGPWGCSVGKVMLR